MPPEHSSGHRDKSQSTSAFPHDGEVGKHRLDELIDEDFGEHHTRGEHDRRNEHVDQAEDDDCRIDDDRDGERRTIE